MRFFVSIWKSRAIGLPAPKYIPETTLVTVQEQALLNYNTINKDALIRERRSINQH